MIYITPNIQIPEKEIEFTAIRAQGSGGQNVNKVSSAIQLRFDIRNSSLPEYHRQQLLRMHDRRITADGILVIKAQSFRTQEQNREDALQRLAALVRQAGHQQKARTPTKPSRAARQKRVDSKIKKGKIKALRKKVKYQ